VNTDDITLKKESFEDMIVIEDLDGKEELLFLSGDIESGNQKLRASEEVQNLVDDICARGLAAAATRLNALVIGSGDLETTLAGANLAGSVIADHVIDVGDVLATLAVGVTPERRCNSATPTHLGVASDINALMTVPVVGNTTEGLSNGAGRIITFALGRVLRFGRILCLGRILRLGRVLRLGGVLGATSLWE